MTKLQLQVVTTIIFASMNSLHVHTNNIIIIDSGIGKSRQSWFVHYPVCSTVCTKGSEFVCVVPANNVPAYHLTA